MSAKIKSYLADFGNSSKGPIGACIRVKATSRRAALDKVNGMLDELTSGVELKCFSGDPEVEYATVYFNPVLKLKDIYDEE